MAKIALCFLTYGNLSQPKLWNSVINNNKALVNVYIHNKYKFIDNDYKLHRYCIKDTVDTKWGHNSLINATLKLFETAFLDEENAFFILLSDKCIPLYSLKFIYNDIFKRGLSQINECDHNSIRRYKNVKNKFFITPSEFYKQSQWMCLSRKDTEFFLKNNFLNIFKNNFFALDEHYWICLLNKHNRKYIKRNITYTNWELKKNSPKLYDSISTNEISQIKLLHNTYFMRKISDKCILPNYLINIT